MKPVEIYLGEMVFDLVNIFNFRYFTNMYTKRALLSSSNAGATIAMDDIRGDET